MTNNLPWFRLYSEILSDRKVKRICAKTGQPKYAVIGFWVSLLSIANESTVRGLLLISDDIPLDKEEIFLECGIDCETGETLLQEFMNLNMIELDEDGIYCVCHWDNRQFASDNSTERVRRHRERKKSEVKTATPEPKKESPVSENGSSPPQSNDTPEKVKRFRNVIDTESDTDIDKTLSKESDKSPPAQKPDRPKAVDVFRSVANRFPDKATWSLIQEAVGDSETNLAFWKRVITGWIACGHNKINIEGMIDHFKRREIPTTKRNGTHKNGPTGPPSSGPSPSDIGAALKARARN